ncbi:uncharacterized protein EI90DRAFT_3154821 [Cantharellus anzutake]|uniref:uncharacterized protein n=1 Tax=Cantharellus anzutake TaxID=1750568 RepID=UPI0019048D73|nr:uncharacterized protein EI90DRAFT_3154821 [Cantharellus anzutake]KAF8330779.1 hypothetical protein EI90DRAFT_3154821 [Cantharellus anzutake]
MNAPTETMTTVRRSSRQSRASNELSIEENFSGSPVPALSEKALGKRPEHPLRAIAATEHVRTPPAEPLSKKATRVLPSRSSRHALGLGNSSIDELIADAQQRAAENKPILPPTALFLLVTDSTLVPPLSEAHKIQSVFDDPNVQRSYKAQEQIQTPEFSMLPETFTVGSRLRARENDESVQDTSDQAYLARHRKFETMEKRQRLREKEKLRYEHYRLKQRIDQLRSIGSSSNNPSYYTGHSAAESAENDKKRRELLREAEDLEKKYDRLLSEKQDPSSLHAESILPIKFKLRFGASVKRSGSSEINSSSAPETPHPSPFTPSPNVSSLILRDPNMSMVGHLYSPTHRNRPKTVPSPKSNRPIRPRLSSVSHAKTQRPNFVPDIIRAAELHNVSTRAGLRTASAFGNQLPSMFDPEGTHWTDFELPAEWFPQDSGGQSDEETLGIVSAPFDIEP